MTGLADGTAIPSPVAGVYLHCEECGGLLRFLIAFRGRALCKSCIAYEAVKKPHG